MCTRVTEFVTAWRTQWPNSDRFTGTQAKTERADAELFLRVERTGATGMGASDNISRRCPATEHGGEGVLTNGLLVILRVV